MAEMMAGSRDRMVVSWVIQLISSLLAFDAVAKISNQRDLVNFHQRAYLGPTLERRVQ